MQQIYQTLLALTILGQLYGCSIPSARPDSHGSISSYSVPKGEGGGDEMIYCFYYSKRIWELGNLIHENQLTLEKAHEVIKNSLGAKGAAEDISDINKLSSGEYKTPEQMAGTRFFRCEKTLKLPIEDRHLAITQSCFGLLKLPRYIDGARSHGKSADEIKIALQASNSRALHRLLETVVHDVFETANPDQLNALKQKIFLSCIVAGGSPRVSQPLPKEAP